MNPQEILQRIKAVIRREANKFKVEIDDLQMPYEIDCGHPFVRLFTETAVGMGCRPRLKGSEGATVITFFKKHNIPAFATGFGARATAHTTDEYIKIKLLSEGTRVLEQFIQEYDRR